MRLPGNVEVRKQQSKKPTGLEPGDFHKHLINHPFILYIIYILYSATIPIAVTQLLSRAQLCNPKNCSTPGLPVFHHLPEFAQTHVHWVNDTDHPSHPLSPPSPPALNLSQHQGLFPVSQLFTSGGLSIGASASGISPSSDYLGLISFRTDWFHLAVQGTESSQAPQFESINSLVLNLLYGPTHITVDLYITTGKTIALTIWTFAGKVLSLLFNTLSRFSPFLPRRKCLLISWL